jgi:hypothetical protein
MTGMRGQHHRNLQPARPKPEHGADATGIILRFAQHILPKGFVRIRHYGFLSSIAKGKRLPALRSHMQISAPVEAAVQSLHRRCPCCKKGKLITLENFDG